MKAYGVLDFDTNGALIHFAAMPRSRFCQIECLVDGAITIEHQVHGELTLEQYVKALVGRGTAVPVQHKQVDSLAGCVFAF